MFKEWHCLPIQAKAYSLWPEPPLFEKFVELLHAIPFPNLGKADCHDHHIVFTDGSCKFQKYPEIGVSSSAAVEALPNGESRLVWAGMVPGQQSIYRGELLAGVAAVMRYKRVTIFTEYLAFLRVAHKIIILCQEHQKPVHLPEEERDLWSLFALSLDEDSRVNVQKTKAHVKWDKSNDPKVRWEGYYNDLADRAAKHVISLFSKEFPFYTELCKCFLKQLNTAKQMALFHARIGEYGSSKKYGDPVSAHSQAIGNVEGPIHFQPPQTIEQFEVKPGLSTRFITILCDWLSGLEWYPQTVDGQEDTSWTELFGSFLLTCHTREGDKMIDDHEDVILYSHTFTQGFKTWRRYISVIQKQFPEILPRKTPISKSILRWNRKGAGLTGRIHMSQEVRATLHQWLSLPKKNLPWPFFDS